MCKGYHEYTLKVTPCAKPNRAEWCGRLEYVYPSWLPAMTHLRILTIYQKNAKPPLKLNKTYRNDHAKFKIVRKCVPPNV